MSHSWRPAAVLAIVLTLSGCAAEGLGSRQAADVAGRGADVFQYQAGPAGRVPQGL
jgi:hypothetical protein